MCRSLPMARTTTSPAVEANTHLHLTPCVRRTSVAVATHGVLHGQGRIAGPHGMIFMGQRAPQTAP